MTEVPGLYFLGLPWQHTRGSALLGWVKDDARYLAGRIGAFAQVPGGHAGVMAEADRSDAAETGPGPRPRRSCSPTSPASPR